MFTLKLRMSYGLEHWVILYSGSIVHTCMSEAGAKSWVMKRERSILAAQR